MIARLVVVIAAVLLIGAQIVRSAAVAMLSPRKPTEAAAVWRSNPSVEISLGMTQIAEAARARRPVPALIFAAMADAATKDRLAPEPFLVAGVRAQLSRDNATAERAFEAAQWRDPLSLAAAYFLADRYFRVGDSQKGLTEVAALARLTPAGTATVAPYLAAYATNPANWPGLRRLFRNNPGLSEVTLSALASNVATAPAVLALANTGGNAVQSKWLATLLDTLTRAGQYDKARAIWGRAAGARPGELIHDPSFKDKVAPPPFNWALTSSSVGMAERQSGGRLHVVFYGQQDGILAEQMLLLQPGTYRLSMQLLGDPARARTLSWSIWCDKAAAPLAGVTLDAAAARAWTFKVPAACPAQWLKLSGSSTDISQQIDVTIGALKLERAAAGA